MLWTIPLVIHSNCVSYKQTISALQVRNSNFKFIEEQAKPYPYYYHYALLILNYNWAE